MQHTHRTTLIAVLLSLLSACNPSAAPTANTSATPAASNENVEALLTKMEQDWTDAILKQDTARIEPILADDMLAIIPNGQTITKPQHLAFIKDETYKPESLSIDNIKVRVFGDSAVVTYHQSEKSQFQGKDNSGETLWTDIFVKRDGRWQIVAEHGSRLEPKED